MVSMLLPGLEESLRSDETGKRLFSAQEFGAESRVPNMVRSVFPSMSSAVLLTCALAAFAGVLEAPTWPEKYGCLLSGCAAFVMSMASSKIAKIRDQSAVPMWLQTGGKSAQENSLATQANEMAVDLVRGCSYVVVMGPLLLRLTQMSRGAGSIFNDSREWLIFFGHAAAFVGLVVRAGTDELAPGTPDASNRARDNIVRFGGLILLAAALTAKILIIVSLIDAAKDNQGQAREIEFFALGLIGYMILAVLPIVWRQLQHSYDKPEDYGYSELLSITKDIGYAVVDFMIFGLLAAGSAFEVFGTGFQDTTFFNSTSAA